MFIQWKGTDVCLDFHCRCGRHGHFDGYFAYRLRCSCGLIYEMGTQVMVRIVEDDPKHHGGTQDLEVEFDVELDRPGIAHLDFDG
jgi:hypothetical protein